jgi:glutathione synthase/RimK-type ligase-like ATP-grasp enzyme
MQIHFEELKITNRLLAQEAISRGWVVNVLDYRLGIIEYQDPRSGKKMLFKGANGPFTRATDIIIADDKVFSAQLAARLGLSVPETLTVADNTNAEDFLRQHEAVVVKPLDSAHGSGVTLDIKTNDQLHDAIAYAAQFSSTVLVQQQVRGEDFRVLCIGGQPAAVTHRHPATVIGDGEHTIAGLIDVENSSGARAADYKKSLNFINKTAAERFLGAAINTIPPAGQAVQVVGMANIGMGGSAENVTSTGNEIARMAGLIAGHLQLAICGVDFLVSETDGMPYFIELNGNPSFGLHVYPAIGESVPVHKMYWDWIEGRSAAA